MSIGVASVQWPAALLVGVVSNLDNFGAGVAFGMRGRLIGAIANLIVAGVTMLATAAAVTCGHLLSEPIPSAVTGSIGPLIVITIGVATIFTCAQTAQRGDSPRTASGVWRHSPPARLVVSWREAIALGVALSVNNLGTGVGAGVAGIPALATTLSAGMLSIACVGGGSHFGRVLGRLVLRRYAPLLAGTLLLVVGARGEIA
jgi:putative Mn2+ efflux pump MntP